MKICLLILIAISVAYCLPADVYKTEWEKFKKQYNRNYSPEEEEFRFELFCKTLDIIRKHNEDYDKGLTTFKMGVNQFSDLTSEEKQKWLGLHSTRAGNDEVKSTYLPAEVYQEKWEKFKKQYNRNYSPEEEEFRFELFCKTLDIIRKHNEDYEKGLTTFKMGVNQFADLTPEEIQKYLGVHSFHAGNGEVKFTYLTAEVYQEEWKKFKKQFNRHYSAEEEQLRYKLFCKTLAIITKHNEDYDKGLTTYKMGLNQFADLTPEEKQKWLATHVLYGENENVKSTHLPKEVYQKEWEKFKSTYKRFYDTPEEEKHRFKIFCKNLEEIYHHNELYAKGLVTYEMEVNKYTDLTYEEVAEMMGFKSKERKLNQEVSYDFEVEWEEFKKRFNKHYNAGEESHRFKIFSENLREIIKHNEDYEKGLSHFRMGITRFTDMTRQEYLKFLEEEAGGVTFAPLQH